MDKQEICVHHWIANCGDGGRPAYRGRGGMTVCCCKCGLRTWMSEKQWNDFKIQKVIT